MSSCCAQALQRLAVASGKLRDLLGLYVHSLVSQLLAEGLQLGQAIMPALVHAIAIGPSSSVASGKHSSTLLDMHCMDKVFMIKMATQFQCLTACEQLGFSCMHQALDFEFVCPLASVDAP